MHCQRNLIVRCNMKFTSGTMICIVIFGFLLLEGAQKYIDSFPYSPPHIKAPPYVWHGGCQKNLYAKNSLSCDCESIKYKISPWSMIKYGINEQRMDGMFRIGNDLVVMTSDFSGVCRQKNIYRNTFYQ